MPNGLRVQLRYNTEAAAVRLLTCAHDTFGLNPVTDFLKFYFYFFIKYKIIYLN
jgi:hypothetical protein